MKEKSLIVIFISNLIALNSHGQVDSLFSRFFYNDSIHYKVIFVSPSFPNDQHPPIAEYLISLPVSKKYRDNLLARDSSFWVKNLSSDIFI